MYYSIVMHGQLLFKKAFIPPPIEVGVFCQNYDKEAVEDWKEGEPVKVWFDFDMDNNLCIEYESGKCWHYNEKGEWW